MSTTPVKRKAGDSDFQKAKAKIPSPTRKSIGEIKVISENHNAEKAKRGVCAKLSACKETLQHYSLRRTLVTMPLIKSNG